MPIESNLQEIIDVLADGTNAAIKNFADGFQYTDLLSLFPVLAQIPAAIQDADHALTYLSDMNKEKEKEIIDAVMAKLQDVSQKTRDFVTYLLHTLINAYMAYKTLATKLPPVQ